MGLTSAIRFVMMIALILAANIFLVHHQFVQAELITRKLGRAVPYIPPQPVGGRRLAQFAPPAPTKDKEKN
ncbi:hypothetical protein PanWU01x14_245000 [Parasponia andersonii]|uniref:Transmembrane protein n=1 Tax=Parasponia andersonii TaxID=3476 RepID=A0A2P5BEU5_PARAD|nr:hypothetical protein PanWU01x14_245000 [Parasponia andersonii]